MNSEPTTLESILTVTTSKLAYVLRRRRIGGGREVGVGGVVPFLSYCIGEEIILNIVC